MEDAPKIQLPRATKVKNKAPAPVQISAEQILRESKEQQAAEFRAPKQKITDPDELDAFRLRKRKEFEDRIRMNRSVMGTWMKYAAFEEAQSDYRRARSVWERALDVDPNNVSVWLRYAEMEMRGKFINHARNVWDRAVTHLPRVDQLWYKYAYMEEMLGNIAGARQIFERWMDWHPEEQPWLTYIKFELRYNELERARGIYERFIRDLREVKSYLRYAKFEEKMGALENARVVFGRAIAELGDEAQTEEFYVAFASFEERCKEIERARVIYKYALDNIPKAEAQELYKKFIAFEKQSGSREAIEDVIVSKRRFQYQEELKTNPRNYDIWFDYIRLEEVNGEKDRIREVYERAIANLPQDQDKRSWRRYIYLWINYALYEETDAQDMERTRQVYREALRVIPHKSFSFSKLWLLAAYFEIRQKSLDGARKVLGMAIGMAPKQKIFHKYIELELQLGNIDRCRALYEKFLDWAPAHCAAWIKFAELEKTLGETDRARAIFELAVEQPLLDMPEVLWKAYIDMERENGEMERVIQLYERLLERTKHIKVWISYAELVHDSGDVDRARDIYSRAYNHFKLNPEQKEERVLLLEAWRAFEVASGDEDTQAVVTSKMPRRVKKKRMLRDADGIEAGWEEYYDYIFPDDETARPNLKILEMARQWKKQKAVDPEEGEAMDQ